MKQQYIRINHQLVRYKCKKLSNTKSWSIVGRIDIGLNLNLLETLVYEDVQNQQH